MNIGKKPSAASGMRFLFFYKEIQLFFQRQMLFAPLEAGGARAGHL